MRKLALLAALALGSAAAPASAAIVSYGLVFTQTYNTYDERLGDPRQFLGRPTGTFTFDTTTNQLIGYGVEPGFVISTSSPNTLNAQALALFAAAGPCDLACFIASINGQSWSNDGGSSQTRVTINFGAPLSGSISVTAPGPQRFYSFGGITSVSGPVPEPGTWALMLIGFGAVGISLRLRRRLAAAHTVSRSHGEASHA